MLRFGLYPALFSDSSCAAFPLIILIKDDSDHHLAGIRNLFTLVPGSDSFQLPGSAGLGYG